MQRKLASVLLMMTWLAAGTAYGDEAAIRKAVQARFPEFPVESVSKTPVNGIYEVVVGGRIMYTDEKTSFIFIGTLLDTRGAGERDLTAERTGQLTTQTLRKSSEQAIKRVRGNGKRVIYTFEDPNCGYCKQLQRELNKVNDITVYTFLWPILSPDSVEKSKAIWCSKDRAKAWDDYMSRGTPPVSDGKCDVPIDKNKQLAQRFRINGTPAIFLADGRMIGGYVPAEQLEQALNSAGSR